MNILKHHYRELLNELDFLKNERSVYMAEGGETPKAPVQEAKNQKEQADKSAKKPEEAQSFTAKNWEAHQKRFDVHINALPDDVKKDSNNNFKKDLDVIKKQYDSQVDIAEADKKQQLEERVATELSPQVQELLDNIKAHPDFDEKKLPESEKKVEKDKKPPISIENVWSLEDQDVMAIGNSINNLILKDYNAFIKSIGLDEVKTKQLEPLKEDIQGFIRALKDVRPLLEKKNYDEYFKKAEEIWKKYEPAVEKFNDIAGDIKDIGKIIEASYKFAIKSEDYPEKDKLTSAKGKLEASFGSAESTTKESENGKDKGKESKEGKKLEGEQLTKATDIIIKQLQIEDPEYKVKVGEVIKTLKFTDKQIEQIGGDKNDKVDLDKNQLKQITDALKINEYDSKKGALIDKLLTNYDKNVKEWGKPIAHAINDMFDTDKKPMRQCLVMMQNVAEKDGTLLIGNKPITKLEELTPYLSSDARGHFEKVLALKGQTTEEQEAALKGDPKDKKDRVPGLEEQLWATSEKNLNGLNVVKQLQDAIANSKDSGSQSPMEAFTMLIQLFSAIKKAISTGDWETLGDFMQEWKNTKNPKELAKKLNESKEGYDKFLDDKKPKDINQLLNAYLNTRGADADALFGKEGATSKFRTNAPDAIKKYLQKQLGLNIISIAPIKENGRTEISANINGKHIAIESFPVSEGKQNAVEIKLYKPGIDKDGKPIEVKDDESGKEFEIATLEDLKSKVANMTGGSEKPADKTPEQLATEAKEARTKEVDGLKKDEIVKFTNEINKDIAAGGLKERFDKVLPTEKDSDKRVKQFLTELSKDEYGKLKAAVTPPDATDKAKAKEEMVVNINTLTAENLKDFKQILKKQPSALVREYNEFVKDFQKDHTDIVKGKWTTEQQNQCRKEFLIARLDKSDDKLVKLFVKPETAKKESTPTKATEDAK